ncbi:hypothetical protein BS50DRAFT_573755 [Corynespora cassiicola Philippines]|uniref:Secreted protein n=1 Tax=Corynespora cassiicola Philippines TaxID=1448308 RepID=A0A2T2NNY4_CORCC|nr:hypothetical protein BS50DRAFT_573755 [Corynespora cassiicola Philippines]
MPRSALARGRILMLMLLLLMAYWGRVARQAWVQATVVRACTVAFLPAKTLRLRLWLGGVGAGGLHVR